MFKPLALAAAIAVMVAAPASAATIDVSQSMTNDDAPFWTTTQNFVLPSDFTNAKLNISDAGADDIAAVLINGATILAFGIYLDSNNGYFFYTPAGPSVPITAYTNHEVTGSFGAPFVVGSNTIEVIVNNNFAGINSGNGGLTGGPSSLAFAANVSYDGAVPEPATWGLMIGGLGGVGAALRSRKRSAAAITA